MAVLALGDKAEDPPFYAPLTALPTTAQLDAAAQNSQRAVPRQEQPLEQSVAPLSAGPAETDSDVLLNQIIAQLQDKHARFSSSTAGLRTMMKRLRRVNSSMQWESFLHTIGAAIPLAHRHHAAIRVQPTALSRRRPGVTRGSRRLPSGRPATTDKRGLPKRQRNLQLSVAANHPNAKSHGSGHKLANLVLIICMVKPKFQRSEPVGDHVFEKFLDKSANLSAEKFAVFLGSAKKH